MRYKMLNLTPHHKVHVPNSLAALAAILLLVSSFASYAPESEIQSASVEATPATPVESTDQASISDSAEPKRRGLNLGSLLFRH